MAKLLYLQSVIALHLPIHHIDRWCPPLWKYIDGYRGTEVNVKRGEV